jgi:hypothetical protein
MPQGAVTILYEDQPAVALAARQAGERLLLSPRDFEAVTGWVLKPQGLCRDEACLILPADGSWVDDEGRIDLAAFSGHLGRPVVRDLEHSIWAVGASAGARQDALSLDAPDFSLPDLEGNVHSLSDFRGRKVFLFSWGSY